MLRLHETNLNHCTASANNLNIEELPVTRTYAEFYNSVVMLTHMVWSATRAPLKFMITSISVKFNQLYTRSIKPNSDRLAETGTILQSALRMRITFLRNCIWVWFLLVITCSHFFYNFGTSSAARYHFRFFSVAIRNLTHRKNQQRRCYRNYLRMMMHQHDFVG